MAARFLLLSLLSTCTLIYAQFILIQEDVNWIEANALCVDRYNSTLATITALGQDQEAASLCSSQSCWIGLSNLFTFSSYSFINNEATTLFADFCDLNIPSSLPLTCVAMNNASSSSCWSYQDCTDAKMSVLCNPASSNIPSSQPNDNSASFGYINNGDESIPMYACQSIDVYSMSFQYICDENDNILKRIWNDNTACSANSNYVDIVTDSTQFVDYSCVADTEQDTVNTVDIDFYQTANLNELVFSKQIIIDECFAIDATSSYQYECSSNGVLHKRTYSDSHNCSVGNMVDTHYDNINYNNDLIAISNCAAFVSSSSTSTNTNNTENELPDTENDDVSSTWKEAQTFFLVVLLLLLVCCLMCLILCVLLWRHRKRREEIAEHPNRKKISYDIGADEASNVGSDQMKSVISYDVEDHGDLPGVELWKARKQSDYESPPVSMFTEEQDDGISMVLAGSVDTAMTMPTTALRPLASHNRNRLVPADSADTEMSTVTNRTNVASSMSTKMPMLADESENVYTNEYYEPTEASAALRM